MANPAKIARAPAPTAEPSAAQILQFEIAARRERFEAYAAASSRAAVYAFVMPRGAQVPALGAPETLRDARDQLQLAVALTGGSVGKYPGGLVARVPLSVAERFEELARALIEAFMVAFRRDGA